MKDLIASALWVSAAFFWTWTVNRLDQKLMLYRILMPSCVHQGWWRRQSMLIRVAEFTCIGALIVIWKSWRGALWPGISSSVAWILALLLTPPSQQTRHEYYVSQEL